MSQADPLEPERPRPLQIPRRVFISGASGFIGRSLAIRYRQLGSEVQGVDKVADAAQGIVAGDTAQSGAWQEHAQGCDLFIHAAAIVSFTHDPRNIWEVNVQGTRHALDAAVRAGIRRFLHISSVVAYSFDFPADVTEQYPDSGCARLALSENCRSSARTSAPPTRVPFDNQRVPFLLIYLTINSIDPKHKTLRNHL